MNYDTQYAFSHGLASAPHFQTLQQQHLQQRQQFQQQQIFPQQQYGQIAPTSNVFFQFTGGGNPVFQQKDIPQMAALATGGIQQTPLGAQHGMVTSSFVKQGVPVRMEGNCVHLVGGPEGMIYQPQPQQSDLKIITATPDTRMLQQHSQLETGLGLPQNTAATILGLDMMGGQPQPLLDQGSLDLGHQHHQQHQGISMAGQAGMLSYNKQQPFSGPWLQPQQQQANSSTGNLQHQQQQTPSALPSFTHLWSQFQQHKNQTGLGLQQSQQQTHMNSIQQSQQFQNQTQLQPSQQFAAASNFPALTSMPMINMSQFQDQSQQQSPLPILPNQISCFSPCGPSSTPSPCSVDRLVPGPDTVLPHTSVAVQVKPSPCQSALSITDDSPHHTTPTLLTDSSSVPPKVTVILDSLPHCETFPPTTHFQGTSETAFKLGVSSKLPCNDSPAVRHKHGSAAPTSNGQLNIHQKKLGLSRSLKPISSTGSSMERSSSESSNFSSPPYAITPPNSNDSLFSPGAQVFHPDDQLLPDSMLEETPTSLCLLSSSLPPPMSPSSISSSPLQNTLTALPKTSGKNQNVKLDGVNPNNSSFTQGPTTTTTTTTTLASVATVITLSSPSTTTVITAMASSHQLVTTTTATTSVTLASHCLIDGSATTVGSCCTTTNHSSPYHKPSKTPPDALNSGRTKLEVEPVKKVKVPFSWHRKQMDSGSIVYLSPSGTSLESYEQICQYLLSDSTCKCGLECPIQVEELFSFDPSVESQPWTAEVEEYQTKDADTAHTGVKQKEDLRKLCNHRRQVLALAALHDSQSQITTDGSLLAGKKRDYKKSVSGGDNLILSPLKRLKTSITNAVNRHAVSTGKKKTSKYVSDTAESYLAGASAMSVTLENHRSIESSSIPSKSIGNKFSGFLESCEDWQELTGDDSLKVRKDVTAQLNNLSSEVGGNFVCKGNFESPKTTSTDKDQPSVVSTADTALPHNLSLDVGPCSSSEESQAVAAHLPSSPALWNSAPALETLHEATHFPKHSTPINSRHDLQVWPEPPKYSGQSLNTTGSPKSKAKRPKSKKEKQKQLFTPSTSKQASSKSSLEDDLALPSNAVSFLENPTVFVAQQTVMINNSMASCKLAYSSPGPHEPSSTDALAKPEKQGDTPLCAQQHGAVLKEDKEERKVGTDTDSNRSFSDATENNDSAYLSQTGSDQERSDTIDGSDSNPDTRKLLDIYDFTCSEEKQHKVDSGIVHVNMKASDNDISKDHNSQKIAKLPDADSKMINSNTAPTMDKKLLIQDKQSVLKPRPKQRSSPLNSNKGIQPPKNGLEHPSKRDGIGSLNKDLSDLLASDNWNIPAVQQVLAQYSGGDPGQLNAAIQQVLSQASTAGVDFPASNLLTAAAQAQGRVGSTSKKPPPNGAMQSGIVKQPGLHNKTDSKSPFVKQQQQQQRQEPVVTHPTDQTVKNVKHLPQGSSAGLTMNTMVSATKQETPQKVPGLLKAVKPESKMVQAIASPHMSTQNMQTPAVCPQPIDVGKKLGLSNPPLIPSSPVQASPGSKPVILNGFGTSRMVMTPQAPPSISGVRKSVSKTTSSVGIGLNQAAFGTVSTPAPHLAQPTLLATAPQQQQQSVANTCIINASNHQLGAAAAAASAGQAAASLQANNTQQLLAPSGHQPTQLAAAQTANAQIMNALSVQGLNPSQQLLLQQMSPCNPVSQLSPAMAAQLLSQNQQQQQQLPQVSPSFLTGGHPQIQKLPQNSVLGNQTGIFASVPLPSFSAASATSNCSGLFTQANTCIPPAQSQQRPGDAGLPAILNASVDGTEPLAHSLPQVKEVAAAASMFAATSQPVFVIPQANANPVVQVLGSTQSLATATDLNVQRQNNNLAAQLFGQQQSQQATPFDPSQLQNVLSTGFNPLALQQAINTLNLSGVHQQQQQLQMLQLQQLMLQQFQNQQNQGLQGISIPGPQTAPQAIVNAVMPTQNLQLSSMVDMNAIHPSLSPVAAAAATHQNLLGNPLSQAQLHISSSIGAQPVVQGTTPATVSVVHNAGLQKVQQTVVKSIPSGPPLIQAPAVTTASEKHCANTVLASHHENFHQKPPPLSGQKIPSGPPLPGPSSSSCKAQATSVSPAPTSTLTPTSPASSSSKSSSGSSKSSKSKSKSKKSETKKVSDPESERNEEDIAATVQQILAQAVQQQRELQLAAKNQPPPPPKSKSKKSQARSKANANHLAVGTPTPGPALATKEHDLGKLPSIMSEDVVIHKPEQAVLSSGASCVASSSGGTSSAIQPLLPTSSCVSLPEPIRPQQLVQQLPPPAKLQPQQQSTFLAAVGSVPPPPPANPSTAAARIAQSSQPAGSEPLVISPVPAQQYIMYQGGRGQATSQTRHKNTVSAVESESKAQANSLCPSSIPMERPVSNDRSPNLASSVSSKKSAISLKDHLSSIISKDKDNSKKKVNGSLSTPRPSRTKDVGELGKAAQVMSLSQQNALKLESVGAKVLRKPVK
ncbi:methyl-CpG-binding domain protein 6 [Elysia marginata]|uniref:Methyl-CpG-binding domain protein 6 n=1 Tax=Elysia marginata TaxID=1093978 RepID=A0AAV4HU06_9GAST|nr:methyl-CpG-binding domain protein 6 [Elysia marginata]